jgi:hypothetical protein
VPDAAHEALRDVVRAREAAKKDELRARHRLNKFLLRHGRRPPMGVKAWSTPVFPSLFLTERALNRGPRAELQERPRWSCECGMPLVFKGNVRGAHFPSEVAPA